MEPNMLSELNKEILSCDSIDLLVSFVKWSGIRCLIESLEEAALNGKKIRIITTSYMGATDEKAIYELAKLPNIEIKILMIQKEQDFMLRRTCLKEIQVLPQLTLVPPIYQMLL